ncbi:MAG TPA: glucose-1-phosphate cytidylyltransferase [Gammaproteobacteria bacterium]|nr:glucose-1-phosphate cytidylyltransferase [Gammaproteobacteria bacterium]
MKVAILAGGLGTRLSEETVIRPKPMVEIGGRPILWHIMNIYSAHGFNDFVLASGYKGECIKEYFANFHLHNSDICVDLRAGGKVELHNNRSPNWQVSIVDTGHQTDTGGRLKRLRPWLNDKTFMMTYGDGVGDINISALLDFHRSHDKLATITAVRPPARFGGLDFNGDQVIRFSEKPQIGEGWINGGFMVLEPDVLEYIEGDDTVFERAPLERLASDGQLMAYRHEGFWQPMDTLREKHLLEELWSSGKAPWKLWD